MDFSVYVVIFECLIIILFGVFARLDSATLTDLSYFSNGLLFLIGFALLSVSRKFLSWLSLGNLLVILALSFQWNLLWAQFWNSCFNGFAVNFNVSIYLFLNCLKCSLCTLLSMTDFLGKVDWRQLLLVCLVQSVGFSLNSAVITFGLKTFDSGGGMQVFFLSGIYSYTMWLVGFKAKEIPITKPTYTYPGMTFGVIGLLLILYGWPSFNVGGSIISSALIVTDPFSLTALGGCAYINTVLTLSAAIISAFLFHTPNHKMKLQHFIYAVINGGIIIASSTDVLLNPAAGLVLGCVASGITVVALKYWGSVYVIEALPDSTSRLVFGMLSGIFASIIVASRNNVVPTLADNLLSKGALELAALAVTLGIGTFFGVGAALIIRFVPGPTKEDMSHDRIMWEIKEESLPIYSNDEVHRDTVESNRLGEVLVSKHSRERENERMPSYYNPDPQPHPSLTPPVTDDRLNRKQKERSEASNKSYHEAAQTFDVPVPKRQHEGQTRSLFPRSLRPENAHAPNMTSSDGNFRQIVKPDFVRAQSPKEIRRILGDDSEPQIPDDDGPPDIVRRLEYDEAAVISGEHKPKIAN